MALPLCQDREDDPAHGAARRAAAFPAAVWLFTALLLTGAGVFIASSLDSGLLGFMGADFLFLIAASLYTSGESRSGRHGR